MKISVTSINNGNTISLIVNSSDTIQRVKKRIQVEKGISTYNQCLFLYGKELENDQYLYHYNVRNGFDFHLVYRSRNVIRIFIQQVAGETFALDVQSNYPVQTIKQMIQEEKGTPCDQQHLYYGPIKLEGSSCLFDYPIDKGSIIHLVRRNELM